MAFVPRKDWHRQLEFARRTQEKLIVMAGVPRPTGEDALPYALAKRESLLAAQKGYKIDGQSELMRGVERSRFRRAFFEEVRLPERVAVGLENFETGLREAGLVGPGEILVQSSHDELKFRVQKRNVAMDGHVRSPSVKAADPGRGPVPSLTEVPDPGACNLPIVKGLQARATLDNRKLQAHAVVHLKRAKRARG